MGERPGNEAAYICTITKGMECVVEKRLKSKMRKASESILLFRHFSTTTFHSLCYCAHRYKREIISCDPEYGAVNKFLPILHVSAQTTSNHHVNLQPNLMRMLHSKQE